MSKVVAHHPAAIAAVPIAGRNGGDAANRSSSLLAEDTRLHIPDLVATKADAEKVLLVAPAWGAWGVIDAPLSRWLRSRSGSTLSVRSMAAEFGVPSGALVPTVTALVNSQLILPEGFESARKSIFARARGAWLFLMVRVTEQCNLRCTYCYEAAGMDGSRGHLALAAAQEALRLFVAHCAGAATILFNGGEALLRPAFLEQCIAFARERARQEGKTLRFAVQTNGTIAPPKVLKFLRDNAVAVGVSFDGTPSMHDAHRPFRSGRGSAQCVWDNIRRFVDAGIRTSLMVTVTQHNVDALSEICEDLQIHGIERVKFSVLTCQGRAAATTLAPEAERYVGALSRLLTAVESGRLSSLRVEQILNLLNQVLLRDRIYLCDQRPCGAACEFLAALPDGYYYPCDTFPAEAAFRLGRIGEASAEALEASPLRMALRQRSPQAAPGCAACPLRAFCGGGCPSNANNERQGMHGIESIVCATSRNLLPELMWRVANHSPLLDYHARHAGLPGAVYIGWSAGTS